VSDDQWKCRGNTNQKDAPMYPDQSTLLSKAQSGDNHAFNSLIEPQLNRIYRAASKITRNHEDAEDACQKGLMKAFAHLRTFRGNAQFSTWLTRIVINEALMSIRKRQSETQYHINGNDMFETMPWLGIADRGNSSDPEVVCARNEQKTLLWEAINQLGGKSRLAVCQFGFESDRTKFVSKQPRISNSGERSRLQRGLRKLREILEIKLRSRREHVQRLA